MEIKDNIIYEIDTILENFCIEGKITSVQPYGSGHINDTFCLINSSKNSPDYLLQRINHHVFKDVPSLMSNIDHVLLHLKYKILSDVYSNPDKNVITLIKTRQNLDFFKDQEGNYWRMCLFLKDTKSYDLVTTNQQAMEGGKAFGRFQALLSDLDTNLLSETIPDFHNIKKRLLAFNAAITHDAFHRVNDVMTEINYVQSLSEDMCTIQQWGDEGKLPKRITHNDTKFNNILFDQDDKAQCIIDLDTVMPGYVAFDFGDAIRTIINTRPEDEQDLEKIELNIPLFKSFTHGYLNEVVEFLTPNEIKSLMLGVLLLPYMQGVRFLTDYLQGDTYFKTNFEGHNLQRAKAQFELLRKLEVNSEVLKQIVSDAEFMYRKNIKSSIPN
ncbi:MAG: aminoglycoside phosphotransferase family protein [Flavobacterium sp.]|nr:aminoglycoside phosphotransferase family protein [Pedobacter sp.]